jgi:hypothetical protein
MCATVRPWKGIETDLKENQQGRDTFTRKDNQLQEKVSQRFLRSWGNDYPYLNGNEKDSQRWLPVPEDSEIQRFLKSPFKSVQFGNGT